MNQTTECGSDVLGFTVHGTGSEAVMVLHDWNGDHTTYDPVRPYLDEATFTYVFVDLRGYGDSRDLTGEYTAREAAADCLAVAEVLGWTRFHVVGHSMTGMVAQRLAADAGDRIKSVVAVCPISAAGSPAPAEALAFFALTTEDDDAFRQVIRFISGELSDQWAEAKLRQCRLTVDPACRAGYLRMLTTAFVEDVRGLETPFLVLIGERDPGLDEAAMEKTFLAWHPNAEIQVIADCGHYPMQERPPLFATLVERYLRTHAG